MGYYSLGIDFGSASARALIVDVKTGAEAGEAVCAYGGGIDGVYIDQRKTLLARQDPADYIASLISCVKAAIKAAKKTKGFSADKIIGIGVDTTGSTPIPVTRDLTPLNALPKFKKNLNAFAWMWKDHTAFAEAADITQKAAKLRPQYLAKCGGVYSSEWFWAKILHCLNCDPAVFNAAYSWIEFCDFIPAALAGIKDVSAVKRSVCAAGHKAMYNDGWGGLPDKKFLSKVSPKLADLRDRLYDQAYASDAVAGNLCDEYSRLLGLKSGIPIAVGAFDCHFGAVGAGVKPGRLVKIIGTSTCDVMTAPKDGKLPEIPGVCGIVDGTVLPDCLGIEAGQSAVGDIFNWFATEICESDSSIFKTLDADAKKLKPGQSGLLALDWNNGNRCVLVDQRLSGLIVGLSLRSGRAEIYRALIEATAFGARKIIERIESYGQSINDVVNCGGIADKNPLFMQIYADVLNRPMIVAGSKQTCALGSAIFGAVAAGKGNGGYLNAESAQRAMCAGGGAIYRPNKTNAAIYKKLYALYSQLHDEFGISGNANGLSNVMKELMAIRDEANR